MSDHAYNYNVMRLGLITLASILGLPLCSLASTVVIQFNELPEQDANGVSINGVTFGFPAGESLYGYTLGIPTENTTDPVLFGDTSGTLTLSFAQATPIFSFDIVLPTATTITNGYAVNLSDSSVPVYSQEFNLAPPNGFILAEGVFSYSGAPIDFASVSFPNTTDDSGNPVSTFAIDNVTFETGFVSPSDPPAVPEPATLMTLPAGLLVLGLARRYSKKRA